jgi:hypothetical protein
VFPVEQSNRERKLKVWEEMVAGVRKQNPEAWSVIEAEATIHSKKKKKKKKKAGKFVGLRVLVSRMCV